VTDNHRIAELTERLRKAADANEIIVNWPLEAKLLRETAGALERLLARCAREQSAEDPLGRPAQLSVSEILGLLDGTLDVDPGRHS
jgi:hypothetical protein